MLQAAPAIFAFGLRVIARELRTPNILVELERLLRDSLGPRRRSAAKLMRLGELRLLARREQDALDVRLNLSERRILQRPPVRLPQRIGVRLAERCTELLQFRPEIIEFLEPHD